MKTALLTLARLSTRLLLALALSVLFFTLLLQLGFPLAPAQDPAPYLPCHPAHGYMGTFYPEVTMDGELGYDILNLDAFIVYGGALLLLCWWGLGRVPWLALRKRERGNRRG